MNDIDKIKSRLDIVDVIGEYLQLKPAGSSLKALCPFHQEKTPSFMVHPAKQIFKCFGCGEGGDVIRFIEKIENVEFAEALKILAQKAGIELSGYSGVKKDVKVKLQDILSDALNFFESKLWSAEGEKALAYLRDRGVKDEIIKKFHVGFAPAGWNNLSKYLSQRHNSRLIIQSGLVVAKGGQEFYDRFRERIMFPIYNEHNIVVGFTGRLMPDKEGMEKYGGKYINTPETPIYHKSNIFFGLNFAKESIRDKGYVIVVEGNMDMIMSHQAGVCNVVASSGTAFTSHQLKLLKRFAPQIVFCFDQDEAGRSALKRSVMGAWQYGFEVGVLDISTGKDPADVVREDENVWRRSAENIIPVIDYFIFLIEEKDGLDLKSPEGQKKIQDEVFPLIKSLPNPLDKQKYINILSDKMDIDPAFIQESIQRLKSQKVFIEEDRINTVNIRRQKSISADDYIMALLIKFPSLAGEVEKVFGFSEFIRDQDKGIYTKLINQNKVEDYPEYEMIIEKEYNEMIEKEAKIEISNLIKGRIKNILSSRLKDLTKKLQKAEENNQKEIINNLLNQISEITLKIREIDKKSLS